MPKLHSLLVTLVTLIVTVILAGCSSSPAVEGPSSSDVDYNALTPYKIGIGDQLNISVWRNAELSSAVPVRPDGKISIALVGDVVAAGKEVPALAKEIEKSLDKFIRNPQVTVIVTGANNAEYNNRVRITGAVGNPVSVPHRDEMTVLDLVLQAGGLTEFASGNKAKLYRKTGDGVKTYKIHLNSIMKKGDLRTNYELMPADILTVPESAF
ncbi:polysaccharide export outer membrane protein [Alteromonadaceae bacterium Bs31]|nr:polysaccharide export outer membrane protein [Alteromonadaceae bacterium Bs31]